MSKIVECSCRVEPNRTNGITLKYLRNKMVHALLTTYNYTEDEVKSVGSDDIEVNPTYSMEDRSFMGMYTAFELKIMLPISEVNRLARVAELETELGVLDET